MRDFQSRALARKRKLNKERKVSQLKILVTERLPQILDDLESCQNETTRKVKIRDTKEILSKVDEIINTF